MLAAFCIGSLLILCTAAGAGDGFLLREAIIVFAASAIGYPLGRKGHAELALALNLSVVAGCVYTSCYRFRGINDVGASLVPLFILLAGLLVNRLFFCLFAVGSILGAIGIETARWAIGGQQQFDGSEARDLFLFTLTCTLSAVVTAWLGKHIGLSYQSMRKSEQRFDELAQQSRTTTWEVDQGGLFTYVSHVCESSWGYRPEEIVGRMCFYDLHPEVGREAYKSAVFAAAAMKQPFRDVLHAVEMKDGRVVWGSTNGIPRLNADGSLLGYSGSCTDVTERQMANEALQESEALLSETGRIARVGGWKLDLNTNQLSWTREVYRIHEVEDSFVPTVETAIGFYTPDSRVVIQLAVERAIERDLAFDLELEILTARNRRLWVHTIGSVQTRAGGARILSGTFQDVTERKRADAEKDQLHQQLAQSQKMESIGRLAGGVAHDFNNLLTVINGYSQLALARSPADDPQHHALEVILNAGKRAADLVHQLLAFSRKQVLQPEVLSLNSTVTSMEEMLKRMMGEDVEIVVRLDPNLGPTIADRHQIERVIMNLAVNARDAMPHGGTLTLETGHRKLDGGHNSNQEQIRPGPYVELTVRDTGFGMDEQTQKHLFEPFFTTKGVGKGTGLGLSTVHGIVIQSGGHVAVESELGCGSSFRVYLPAAPTPASEAKAVAKSAVEGGTEIILLVEDQDEVRRFVAAALAEYGYRVVEAADAFHALSLCDGEPPDLLVTDVSMPKMSGVELAKRIRLMKPGLKTLFISGYSQETHEEDWEVRAGGKFLQKPFSPDMLAEKVREALTGR